MSKLLSAGATAFLGALIVVADVAPGRAVEPGPAVKPAEPSAAGALITALVDEAKLVKVPAGTRTLVIGNPTIADVTLLRKNNVMILTPKAFGETNFIALDEGGSPVAESTIRVIAGPTSLIVQRGSERQSYSCAPRCQPTERLGDDDKYLNMVASQDQAHTQRLSGSTAPVGPGFMAR